MFQKGDTITFYRHDIEFGHHETIKDFITYKTQWMQNDRRETVYCIKSWGAVTFGGDNFQLTRLVLIEKNNFGRQKYSWEQNQ